VLYKITDKLGSVCPSYRAIIFLCLVVNLTFIPFMLHAQSAQRLSFIRDAEIEEAIRTLSQPLWQATGLNGRAVTINIIDDNSLNAFVAAGQNIFLHTGLLRTTDNVHQLLGVLAHEYGHMAGGHLIRGFEARERSAAQAMIGSLAGLAAALLAKNGEAAGAILLGSQAMAQRSFFAFNREQEEAADQSAIDSLARNQLSPRGLVEFLGKLADQELLPYDRQSLFVRTHPLTIDRIEHVRGALERSPYAEAPPPPAWEELHRRIQAKLYGYQLPLQALRRYAEDQTIAGRYARAVAHYRRGDMAKSLAELDGLLRDEPQNPFFYELQGQLLFETGELAQSIAPFAKAVALRPQSALLQVSYARALLEGGGDLDVAQKSLKQALVSEPESPLAWRLLATVYSKQGNEPEMQLASAEEALLRGDVALASERAKRVIASASPESGQLVRAQDILLAAERIAERRRR
jgi:predicted Zn-dependent protease